ncbi:MAG TPA: helix-turn-helix transcriptional regulator [Solirubrobacterales bacterium]|jgi:transcriptional regulator with XRE-family HTH domain
MSVAKQFGENLRRCRRRAGMSQEEAAVRASLHRTEIGLLERGERVPRIDTAIKVAGAVGATPSDLFEGIEWTPGAVQIGQFSGPASR